MSPSDPRILPAVTGLEEIRSGSNPRSGPKHRARTAVSPDGANAKINKINFGWIPLTENMQSRIASKKTSQIFGQRHPAKIYSQLNRVPRTLVMKKRDQARSTVWWGWGGSRFCNVTLPHTHTLSFSFHYYMLLSYNRNKKCYK